MGPMETMTFVKIILGISFGAFAVSFWALMIKDCIKEMEGFERYQWCLILIIGNVIASLVYFLGPRRKRLKERGY